MAYRARGRIAAAGLVVGFVALNAVAFLHAYAMTHFSGTSGRMVAAFVDSDVARP